MSAPSVDRVLHQARQRARSGQPDEAVKIRRGTLDVLVGEIEQLRASVAAVGLPNQNTEGRKHRRSTDTERAAALRVMPKTGTQRLTVLRAIAAADDGLTDVEVADVTGLYHYSAAPRRNELLIGGWVMDSGRRRETGNGGEGIVWIATDKARAALRHNDN